MIPIKDTVPRRTYPFVTVGIISVNVLIFIFETRLSQEHLEAAIRLFGLVPARFEGGTSEPLGYLSVYGPFITNIFLHGGWLHVIANMWSLYIFGDNVEDLLGPVRFLVFYLLSGISANVVHFVMNLDSIMPVIGASGAVAGVMAGYLTLFPRARVVILFPVLFFPFFFEVPALLFMGIWFFSQIVSGTAMLMMAHEGGGIAWWAHVGGFLVGFLLIRPMCGSRPGGCHFPPY